MIKTKYIFSRRISNIHAILYIIERRKYEIYAVADVTVVDAGFDNMGNGYYVLIDHGNNVQTLYGHLEEELQVKVGDVVTQGQVIGFEGDTGNVTAPNMHFEIIVDGISQDPNQYLA